MIGVFVAFIMVGYGKRIYITLPIYDLNRKLKVSYKTYSVIMDGNNVPSFS